MCVCFSFAAPFKLAAAGRFYQATKSFWLLHSFSSTSPSFLSFSRVFERPCLVFFIHLSKTIRKVESNHEILQHEVLLLAIILAWLVPDHIQSPSSLVLSVAQTRTHTQSLLTPVGNFHFLRTSSSLVDQLCYAMQCSAINQLASDQHSCIQSASSAMFMPPPSPPKKKQKKNSYGLATLSYVIGQLFTTTWAWLCVFWALCVLLGFTSQGRPGSSQQGRP